jgi:hypothetical protein
MNSRLASSLSAPPASLRRYTARGVCSAASRNSDKRTRILACSAGDNGVFGAGEPREPVSGDSRLTGEGKCKSGGAAGRLVDSGSKSGAPCGSGDPDAAGSASDFSSFGEGEGCCATADARAKTISKLTEIRVPAFKSVYSILHPSTLPGRASRWARRAPFVSSFLPARAAFRTFLSSGNSRTAPRYVLSNYSK